MSARASFLVRSYSSSCSFLGSFVHVTSQVTLDVLGLTWRRLSGLCLRSTKSEKRLSDTPQSWFPCNLAFDTSAFALSVLRLST